MDSEFNLYFDKAHSDFISKDYDEALKNVDLALGIEEDYDTLLLKAEILYKLKEYKKALSYFDRVLNEQYNVKSLVGKSQCLFYMERYSDALDCYNEAIDFDEECVDVQFYNELFGLAEMEKKSDKQIEKYIGLAGGCLKQNDFEDAIKYCDLALNINSQSPIAIAGKGWVFAKKGEYEKALEYFDESLKISRNSQGLLGKVYVSLKLDGNSKQNLEKNMEYIDEAVRLDESALFYKAEILNKVGNYDEAITCYNKYLENNTSVKVMFRKASVFKKLKRYEAALDSYEEILAIEGNSVEALTKKGEIMYLVRDCDNALDVFDEVLKLDGKNVDALIYKGHVLKHLTLFHKANKFYDKAFEIDNERYDALLFKTEVLAGMHLYEQAIVSYKNVPAGYANKGYGDLIEYSKDQIINNRNSGLYSVSEVDYGSNRWNYAYMDDGDFKLIVHDDLDGLEEYAKERGLVWAVVNKECAEESYQKNLKNNDVG